MPEIQTEAREIKPLWLLFDGLSIGQKEYIPHVLRGELIPDRNPDYMLALECCRPFQIVEKLDAVMPRKTASALFVSP